MADYDSGVRIWNGDSGSQRDVTVRSASCGMWDMAYCLYSAVKGHDYDGTEGAPDLAYALAMCDIDPIAEPKTRDDETWNALVRAVEAAKEWRRMWEAPDGK